MTRIELAALVQLINRFTTMMSEAERLWIQGTIQRLAAEIELRESKRAKDTDETAVQDIAPVNDPA